MDQRLDECEAQCFGLVGAAHADGELIAAQPGHERPRGDRPEQTAGDLAQHLVAGVVPVRVVDVFEVVKVEQGQDDRCPRGSGQGGVQLVVQRGAVAEAGQRVTAGSGAGLTLP